MEQKNKRTLIIILKTCMIVFSILFGTSFILAIIGACIPNTISPYIEISKNITVLVDYLLTIAIVFGGILIFLMHLTRDTKWYAPNPTKPDIYKLNTVKSFLESYKKELKSEGYNSYKYQYPSYQIDYFVKNKKVLDNLIFFIEVDELTNDLYSDYENNIFKELGVHILRNEFADYRKQINIFVFIKISKPNSLFEKYISIPPIQQPNRTIVSLGISNENESIFIINQEKGSGLKKYKKTSDIYTKK